ISIEDILVRTDVDDIVVMPAGAIREDSTELLASRRMKSLLRALSKTFSDRLVILDTPPMLITTEAQVLADHVGQVVLVIEAGVTAHAQLLEVLEVLDRDKPVNAILNKSRNVATHAYGSGYYGYAPASSGGKDNEPQEDR
ncbi:MAG: chromosome partitioning ATPase, partial [Cyanobacteria bacterium J06648_11]